MKRPTVLESGSVFGRLRVECYAGEQTHRCTCECGEVRIVKTYRLLSGHTRSCGCLRWARHQLVPKSHKLSKLRAYDIWKQMVARCGKPENKEYRNYGGRGIRVCLRWMDVENFFADMGECPEGFSIDREDVNGDYEPNNCRWIPLSDQAATRRSSKRRIEATPSIVALRRQGLTQDQIASIVAVDQTTVSRVLAAHGLRSRVNSGRNWRSS